MQSSYNWSYAKRYGFPKGYRIFLRLQQLMLKVSAEIMFELDIENLLQTVYTKNS